MVTERSFPEDFSQSTIGGRNGSNACAFICLYFGQVASKGLLVPKQGLTLSNVWREVLKWAITSGNDLHNELFDHEGVNVNADEPVEIAGEECGVACLGQQKDFFGSPKELLAEYLNSLALGAQRSCHLFFSSERTMFLMCDSGNLYFLDSHFHKDSGALIVSVHPGNGEAFTEWIDKMMNFHWQCPLTIGSMVKCILHEIDIVIFREKHHYIMLNIACLQPHFFILPTPVTPPPRQMKLEYVVTWSKTPAPPHLHLPVVFISLKGSVQV